MNEKTYSVECSQCGKSAVCNLYEDGNKYINCYRCGYMYSKYTYNGKDFEENEVKGYGMYKLVKKDGDLNFKMLDNVLEPWELHQYFNIFNAHDTDQNKSFIVRYINGQFYFLMGEPTENFLLPFEKYKENMEKKYNRQFNKDDVPYEE